MVDKIKNASKSFEDFLESFKVNKADEYGDRQCNVISKVYYKISDFVFIIFPCAINSCISLRN